MIALRLDEIAAAVGGALSSADPASVVTSVCIDSRRAESGALFVALPGERADGHDFARAALDAGATAVLCARSDGGAAVIVEDPLRALGLLAEAVRARLSAKVVAITGSSGKTGTKDFIAAALSATLRTVASEASLNNEIGVPLTILRAREDTQALVVEVGSRGAGHIAALMPIVRPDISVVTNVGAAHAGMFGSLEATAAAKGELIDALGADGTAVLNADDDAVLAMAARVRGEVVTFGRTASADVRAIDVRLNDDACAEFTVVAGGETAHVTLAIPGEHMVSNALAALAVARALGVPLAVAAAGVGECRGSAWRMEVHDVDGRRIINDAYNANPDSMAAALKTLVAMARGRASWAVLGHMAELGATSVAAHDRIGRLAVRLGVHHVVTVGTDARALHEAARHEGMNPEEAMFVAGVDEAIAVLRAQCEPNAVVLIKASRAAGLERVAAAMGAGA